MCSMAMSAEAAAEDEQREDEFWTTHLNKMSTNVGIESFKLNDYENTGVTVGVPFLSAIEDVIQ